MTTTTKYVSIVSEANQARIVTELCRHWDSETDAEIDGLTVKLKREYDDCASVNDFDCYGMIVHSRRTNEYGRRVRPSECDGRAILHDHDCHGATWWQPPTYVRKTEDIKALYKAVRPVLEHGFEVYILTLEDEDGNEVGSACVGGVDYSNKACVHTVADMLAEACKVPVTLDGTH